MEQSHHQDSQPKAPMMGVFFSPPEAPMHDTFSTVQSPVRQPCNPVPGKGFNDARLPALRHILSPPVSPATRLDQVEEHGTADIHDALDVKDPVLFPRSQSVALPDASQPLFRPADPEVVTDSTIIDLHIQDQETSGSKRPRPTRDDYILAATFRQRVVERYNADPRKYIAKELEFLTAYPASFAPVSVTASPKRKHDLETRGNKRQKTAFKSVVEKLPTVKRAPRASPRDFVSDSFESSPAPVKHRRKPSQTAPVAREDMDFRKIPDLSPAVSTMAPGKNLKIDWKGHPLDLSDDPDRNLLDEQEANLASVLRLTAGQYLFAKRKIFERYVELARIGKDFNKTSAQAVCHIDVNKASKLWTAFEKVGWFDRRHFAKYL